MPAVDGPASWGVAASAFLSTYAAFGVAYSFGAFFGPMADEFGSDRGATALFFAITTFLYFAIGVVTGRVADAVGPRPVLVVGAVCMVAGLLITSRVQSIALGYLTYGLGVGIGVACAYVPMVAAVGGWFERRRTTALGLAVAGIGVGTLTVVPLAEALIERYGWRRTYVILAVGAAVVFAVAVIGARRPPVPPGAAGASLFTVIRSSTSFWVLYASMVAISITLFVPFVFLADYLETTGGSGSAGWLIGLIGISSVLGRLGMGALAGRLGSTNLYRSSYLVLSLSFVLWLVADGRYPVLMVFAVILGVAYGGFIALAPAVTAEQFGTLGLGAILGGLYTAAGFGGLLGPPFMGWLIDGQGYTTALVVALVTGLAGTAILAALPRPGTVPAAARQEAEAGTGTGNTDR